MYKSSGDKYRWWLDSMTVSFHSSDLITNKDQLTEVLDPLQGKPHQSRFHAWPESTERQINFGHGTRTHNSCNVFERTSKPMLGGASPQPPAYSQSRLYFTSCEAKLFHCSGARAHVSKQQWENSSRDHRTATGMLHPKENSTSDRFYWRNQTERK